MSHRNSRRGGEAPDCVEHLYSLFVIRYSFLKTSYLIKRFGIFNQTQLVGHKHTVVIIHVIIFAKSSLYQSPHKMNNIETGL